VGHRAPPGRLPYAGHARCRLTEVITQLHTRIDIEAIDITNDRRSSRSPDRDRDCPSK
jgi:hypothetical protein